VTKQLQYDSLTPVRRSFWNARQSASEHTAFWPNARTWRLCRSSSCSSTGVPGKRTVT